MTQVLFICKFRAQNALTASQSRYVELSNGRIKEERGRWKWTCFMAAAHRLIESGRVDLLEDCIQGGKNLWIPEITILY